MLVALSLFECYWSIPDGPRYLVLSVSESLSCCIIQGSFELTIAGLSLPVL